MRGGTDRVPDIGIIVSGHTSLRNADRRSNQSVAALGALVAQKRGCAGALPAALPLFAAGLGALGLLRLAEEASRLLIVSPKGIFWSLFLAHGSQQVECVADVADGSWIAVDTVIAVNGIF
jgi:hypothetical protein